MSWVRVQLFCNANSGGRGRPGDRMQPNRADTSLHKNLYKNFQPIKKLQSNDIILPERGRVAALVRTTDPLVARVKNSSRSTSSLRTCISCNESSISLIAQQITLVDVRLQSSIKNTLSDQLADPEFGLV